MKSGKRLSYSLPGVLFFLLWSLGLSMAPWTNLSARADAAPEGADPLAVILPPSSPDRMSSALGTVYLRRELRSFFCARGYELAMDDDVDAAWADVLGIPVPVQTWDSDEEEGPGESLESADGSGADNEPDGSLDDDLGMRDGESADDWLNRRTGKPGSGARGSGGGGEGTGSSAPDARPAWTGKGWPWIDSRVKSDRWVDPVETPPLGFFEKVASATGARVVVWSRLKEYKAKRDHGEPYGAAPVLDEDLDWTRFINDPTSTGGTIRCNLGARVVVWHAPDRDIIHDRMSVITHEVEFFGSVRSRLEALRGGVRKLVALLLKGLYQR